MSYNEVFGGGSISPSQRTYLSIVSAVDVTLQWPLNAVGGDNIAADIIDADMTQAGLTINFSDARQVSKGFTSLVSNVGSIDFTVRDALGGAIVSPVPGTAWFIYLQDNSTEDGTWAIFQLGATMAVADAAALAGAGIKAIGTTLNQRIFPTLTSSTPITWTDSNRAQFTIWTGGVGVLDLPDPGVVGADWFAMVRNEGSGILTVTPPSGTIDSAATLVMNPGDSVFIITNNTDFWTIGLGGSTTVGFDYVQIDVSGSGDFILSGVQLNRISYNFIGLLTGTRKIVVPNTIQQYWMDNSTTGAFDLEIATAAQVTPLTVVQNNRSIFYCDGTDVLDAETGSLTPPITIGQGGTSATDAPTALSNLGGVPLARIIDTSALGGLAGGGDLTIDRDITLDTDNLTVELVVDTAADTIAFYDDSASAMRKTPFDAFVFTLTFPIQIPDNDQIQWGTGNDIQQYFDGGVAMVFESTLAGGQAIYMDSTSVAATLEIDMRNSTAGCRLDIEGVTGTINFAYTTTPGGVRTNRLWVGNLADGQLLLLFGDSFVANTALVTSAYPHFVDGGFEINNNGTGNGQSRALTWYDQHFAVGNTNLSRNLVGATPVEDPNLVSDDGGAPTMRIGYYKFEMFMVIQGQDTTTDFIFDFDVTNVGFMSYTWEAESADGTPFSRGASANIAADQTVDLGATVGEEIMLRVRGIFNANANGAILNFRWAPSANVIDDVTRQQGAYMGIAAMRIG